MIDLSALAGELDALVRDGRRIRLGDRDFTKPHAELDDLLGRLAYIADRTRMGVVPLPELAGAPNGPIGAEFVTGRAQIIVCSTRGPRR